MRAYQTIWWLTEWDWTANYYYKEKISNLEKLWFKRDFWHYINAVGRLRIWIDTRKGWYIDYQDQYSGHRIAPNQIKVKDYEGLQDIIKGLKEIGIIK